MRRRAWPWLLTLGGVSAATLLGACPGSALALLAALGCLFLGSSPKVAPLARGVIFAAILLVAFPVAGCANSFLFELSIQMGIFAALALGLNVVVGMAGLLDLGYIGFFAIGAYVWAIFGSPQANQFLGGAHFPLPAWPWFFLFVAAAAAVAALAGMLVGLSALRLRGDYLAIVTLGFGQVVRLVANNLDKPVNITNGPQGISPIGRPAVGWLQQGLHALGIEIRDATADALFLYLLILLVVAVVIVVSRRLDRSRFGRAWVAVREDEIAARAAGIAVLRAKLLACATGAAFSGAMGALFAAKQVFVSPESFTFLQSVMILVMVLLGGMGSIRGVILGAGVVTLLNIEILKNLSAWVNDLRQSGRVWDFGPLHVDLARLPTQLEPAQYERMLFGLLLVLLVIFRPGGLVPEARHRLEMEEKEEKQP